MDKGTISSQDPPNTKVYVPPHLRRLHERVRDGPVGENPAGDVFCQSSRLYSSESIRSYYWPSSKGKDEDDDSSEGDEKQEIDDNETGDPISPGFNASRTLHSSAKAPERLAYILLFPKGNPRWDKDRIIFAKSNLELLKPFMVIGNKSKDDVDEDQLSAHVDPASSFGMTSEVEPSSLGCDLPIPVFSSFSYFSFFGKDRKSEMNLFALIGHFRVLRVDILEPYSAELERMMLQKWDPTGRKNKELLRREVKWRDSFARRWAVVQLVAADEEEDKKEKDGIESGEEKKRKKENWRNGRPGESLNVLLEKNLEPFGAEKSSVPKLTVTQMLQEMRMADSVDAAAAPVTVDEKENVDSFGREGMII